MRRPPYCSFVLLGGGSSECLNGEVRPYTYSNRKTRRVSEGRAAPTPKKHLWKGSTQRGHGHVRQDVDGRHLCGSGDEFDGGSPCFGGYTEGMDVFHP